MVCNIFPDTLAQQNKDIIWPWLVLLLG